MWGGGRGGVCKCVDEGGGRGGQDSWLLGPPHLHGHHHHPQSFWCELCVCRRGEVLGRGGGICKCVVGEGVGEEEGGQDSLLLGPLRLHGHHRRPQPFWCVLCVCRRGEVWGGEGGCKCVDGGGGRGGTRQPASATSAPPPPSLSSPALLVCTVCVCRRGEVCVWGVVGGGVFASVWMGGSKRGGQASLLLGPPRLHGHHRRPQSFWCVLCVYIRGEVCVCGGGVGGRGVFASVWMGGEGGGRKRGTRRPAYGTCTPPLPSPSFPALLVCTVCV